MWNIKFGPRGRGDNEMGREETLFVSSSTRLPVVGCILLSVFCLLLSGCRMDMQDQPRYEAYEAGDKKFFPDGGSARVPVEGTVPRQKGGEYRDREDYMLTGKNGAGQTSAQTASMMMPGGSNTVGNTAGGVPGAAQGTATGGPDIFPMEINEDGLKRGRERYNIYCIVCHGATGEGDGMIVRRGYRKPPSFYEDRLQDGTTPAAHFFDVITNGWGAMPNYAEQIPAEDRWKIIAYIRTLQLSRRLKMEDLSEQERSKVTSGAQSGEGHGAQGEAHAAGGENH